MIHHVTSQQSKVNSSILTPSLTHPTPHNTKPKWPQAHALFFSSFSWPLPLSQFTQGTCSSQRIMLRNCTRSGTGRHG